MTTAVLSGWTVMACTSCGMTEPALISGDLSHPDRRDPLRRWCHGPVISVRYVPCDPASLELAARAVHEVTGGGAPFGKSPRSKTKVSAALLVETVVRALGASE